MIILKLTTKKIKVIQENLNMQKCIGKKTDQKFDEGNKKNQSLLEMMIQQPKSKSIRFFCSVIQRQFR